MKDIRQVVVAGGINIDIAGKAFAPLIARDSNPGAVRLSMGGVGRNIAHNLCLLGVQTQMLTALGDDGFARQVEESCKQAGIGLDYALRVPQGITSTYLCINGPEGDMELAVCDAELSKELTPAYAQEKLPILNRADAVVLETNLPEETIAFLAENCTAPLFADPVSVTKAEKLKRLLGKLHTLKPNRIEAELLSGIAIHDDATLEAAADALLATGLKRVFISLGGEGLYCAEAGKRLKIPCPPTKLVNATGGGDALMAGLVKSYLEGSSLAETARFALSAGSLAVEASETIQANLTVQAVQARAAYIV